MSACRPLISVACWLISTKLQRLCKAAKKVWGIPQMSIYVFQRSLPLGCTKEPIQAPWMYTQRPAASSPLLNYQSILFLTGNPRNRHQGIPLATSFKTSFYSPDGRPSASSPVKAQCHYRSTGPDNSIGPKNAIFGFLSSCYSKNFLGYTKEVDLLGYSERWPWPGEDDLEESCVQRAHRSGASVLAPRSEPAKTLI